MDWASSAYNIQAASVPYQTVRIFVPHEHQEKATQLTSPIFGNEI